MVDGEVIAEGTSAARLRAWWQFSAGQHSFWLEGQRTLDSEPERTPAALVVVENSATPPVTQISN